MMSNSPSGLQFRLFRESPRRRVTAGSLGKCGGGVSEVVAPTHWVHGNLVRSCAWSPVLLYLELPIVTMATPAEATARNGKNKSVIY